MKKKGFFAIICDDCLNVHATDAPAVSWPSPPSHARMVPVL